MFRGVHGLRGPQARVRINCQDLDVVDDFGRRGAFRHDRQSR